MPGTARPQAATNGTAQFTASNLASYPVTGACTFDSVYHGQHSDQCQSGGRCDCELYKNGGTTGVKVTVTSSTMQNVATANNATGFSVSVVAGDTVAVTFHCH